MANNPNTPHPTGTGSCSTTGRFGGESSHSGMHTGHSGTQGAASSATGTIKDTASSVMDKAKDIASSVSDQAQDTFSNLKDSASDLAGNVTRRANEAWETSRDYVTNEGFSGMVDDVSDVIRRNPLPALLIGFGLGFVLARALKE